MTGDNHNCWVSSSAVALQLPLLLPLPLLPLLLLPPTQQALPEVHSWLAVTPLCPLCRLTVLLLS
jgi:hypothetical protein